MYRRIAVLIILNLSLGAIAQKPVRVFSANSLELNTSILRDNFRRVTSFSLESKGVFDFVHESGISLFRLNLGTDMVWDIDLERSPITSSNYHLKVLTPEGTRSVMSQPDFLFKGKVRGSNKNEEVRLSIKDGLIYGSIQTRGKEYFIEPIDRFIKKKQKDEYIVYETKDIINGERFSCGVQDKQSILKETEQQPVLEEQSPQGVICKTIKFISVADYSIYQKFGNDVTAVETALLSNLNMAEGAYSSLNLGPNASNDIGTDRLQLEMEEILVSTCSECDIVSKTESAPDLGLELNTWLTQFYPNKGNTIFQFWTTRSLFELGGKALGGISFSTINCSGLPARQILKYHTDDPGFLRMIVAHETGHLLGCRHDDEVKPDVKGFIMQSSIANPAVTIQFSTLSDFGGINYSSQKAIHDFINFRGCLLDCQTSLCDSVKNLTITYFNSPDSVRFGWGENGTYVIRYKTLDSFSLDSSHVYEITGNSVTIKNLSPCTLYFAEVQEKCGTTSYGQKTSVILNVSSLFTTVSPINIHGDKYDLELKPDCKNCTVDKYVIKIDNEPYLISNENSLSQVIIKDLFADGARHRIDLAKASSRACVTTVFYQAPYYRSNSARNLSADFNDCVMAMGWKDTLLAKAVSSQPNAQWTVSDKNSFSLSTLRGNFGSSCIIYYNRYNSFGLLYSGAVSLTSPPIDVTKYENIKLHFDYNFLSFKAFGSNVTPNINIQVFDGVQWRNVFKRSSDIIYPNTPSPRRNIWDSIPRRVFIDLDDYRNENLKLQFIADDGSLTSDSSGYLFVAFDNIEVDGYPKNSGTESDIVVYPNPTKQEWFVKFRSQPVPGIEYRITDASGRIVCNGILTNYRVEAHTLTAGLYLMELHYNGRLIAVKKIVKL